MEPLKIAFPCVLNPKNNKRTIILYAKLVQASTFDLTGAQAHCIGFDSEGQELQFYIPYQVYEMACRNPVKFIEVKEDFMAPVTTHYTKKLP